MTITKMPLGKENIKEKEKLLKEVTEKINNIAKDCIFSINIKAGKYKLNCSEDFLDLIAKSLGISKEFLI